MKWVKNKQNITALLRQGEVAAALGTRFVLHNTQQNILYKPLYVRLQEWSLLTAERIGAALLRSSRGGSSAPPLYLLTTLTPNVLICGLGFVVCFQRVLTLCQHICDSQTSNHILSSIFLFFFCLRSCTAAKYFWKYLIKPSKKSVSTSFPSSHQLNHMTNSLHVS